MKRVTFITAFPEFLESFLAHSVVGRAVRAGIIEASVVNLRDFAVNRYGQVDDYSFGSGGMVLMAEPLAEALESLADPEAAVIYPSPQGVVLSQELVESLAARDHLVLVCGHYEGIDERFVEKHVSLEVSLGDFVLTGGELPSMVLVDAVSRLVPGVVGRIEAVEDDSFFRGMLDHPHFTRPAEWRGIPVPQVLLSGDAASIDRWRKEEAVARTILRRPDLLGTANIRPYLSKRPYVLLPGNLACLPGALGQLVGLAKLYGLERVLIVEQDEDRRGELSSVLTGTLGEGHPQVKFFKTARQAFQWVSKREGGSVFPVGVNDCAGKPRVHWMEAKRQVLETKRPLVLCFLPELPENGITLAPLRGGLESEERVDPVLVLSVFVDRFFGCR